MTASFTDRVRKFFKFIVPATSRRTYPRFAGAILPLALACYVAANSMNYVTPFRPGPDAGYYSLGAAMLNDGHVLYRDIFAGRPPVIYVMNALALSIGDGTFHSIRVLERVLAVTAALSVFAIVLTVFERRLLAALSAIGFSFYAYRNEVFEQGNVTEEYAIVFVFAGILCAVRAALRFGRASGLLAFLSGACFCCAALAKEPFVLSGFPWFLFLVIRPHAGWRQAARLGFLFVLGSLAPLVLFFSYLVLNEAWHAWLQRLLGGFNYVADSKQHYAGTLEAAFSKFSSSILFATRIGLIAFVFGVIGTMAFPRFSRRYAHVPMAVLFALVMEFLGATRSPRFYGHYFLQAIPSFILCCTCGFAFIFYLRDRALEKMRSGQALGAIGSAIKGNHRYIFLFLVLALGLLDSSAITAYWQRLNQPFVRAEVGRVSAYIKAQSEPGDRLWVTLLSHSRFNIETGLTPPLGFFLEPQHPGERTTAEEKLALLKTGGESAPTWIVVDQNATSLHFGDLFFGVCEHYTRAPFVDQGYGSPAYFYLRNDRAAELLISAQLRTDALCIAEYITKSVSYYTSGEFEKSIEICNKVLASEPNSVLAYNNICASHLQLGQFDKAINACEKALGIDPDFARAKGNLAAARAGEASQAR